MSTWVTAWFVLGLISAVAFVVCVAGLVKHLLVLKRTLQVFQDEIAPVTEGISDAGRRASYVAANLKPPSHSPS